MTLLVDTSVFVSIIRGEPKAHAWIVAHGRTALSASAATILELERGVESSADKKMVSAVLHAVVVVAIDGPIAERAGALWRRYGPSHGVDAIDSIIAATAQIARLPLVTHNVKHFPMLNDVNRPF
jgi:hypothetical protein